MAKVHPDDKRVAQKVVELKLARRAAVEEALRILAVRHDVGEASSLEQVLFERDVLDARRLDRVQQASKVRTVFCPSCEQRLNLFETKPGSKAKCTTCKTKVLVPDAPEAPSESAREPARATPEPEPRGLTLVGLAGTLGAFALLVDAALESRGGPLALPAAVCAGAFGLGAGALRKQLRPLTLAAIGLVLVTGLLVAATLGHAPGSGVLRVAGFDAHRALPALVLLHVVVALFAAHELFMRARSALPLLGLLPVLWGMVFFTWRAFSADPGVWLAGGPSVLDRVPWFLHPGALTLLLVFPAAALLFLGGGVVGLVRGQPALLLRRVGVGASFALLAAFGLAVGAARGELRHPELERRVQTALAGRLAPTWTKAESVAVALTPAPETPR